MVLILTVSAILRRTDLMEIIANNLVCCRHFLLGKPAWLLDEKTRLATILEPGPHSIKLTESRAKAVGKILKAGDSKVKGSIER